MAVVTLHILVYFIKSSLLVVCLHDGLGDELAVCERGFDVFRSFVLVIDGFGVEDCIVSANPTDTTCEGWA